ncbi:MmgE/PrpD family protein [SAR202 cluster bacterium AD-804-J14_MRT_500m]|nr:MmgE/PrpD family protein [SAR202 cluster bacterium AD-804-J14_MRT_500m]
MRATDEVVEFIQATQLSDIPGDVKHLGKRAILDTLGVALAGSGDESVRILLETMAGRQGDSRASLIGSGQRTDSLSAALINGTMAHALDYDDVNESCMGHPSAPILPAVIALGEELDKSGADVLEAFLVGFELECKLGSAIGRSHYGKGWHATATLGTIGAAAACARLMGLDSKATEITLGIAASLASGIRSNFGTMTKPLHVGEASRNGVLASLLASKGFTATSNVFDHPIDFGQVFSEDKLNKDYLIESLGSPWDILTPGITVKKYPCCNKVHRTVDATLGLVVDHHPQPSDISEVVITIPPGEDVPLIYKKATTGLEGKFCMQFCVASAIVDGEIVFNTFETNRVERAEVQQLSDKVTVVTDESQIPVVIDTGGHVDVSIIMQDGRIFDRKIEKATGTPTFPLSDNDLQNKFRSCAKTVLNSNDIETAIAGIYDLENLRSTADLMHMLSVASTIDLKV